MARKKSQEGLARNAESNIIARRSEQTIDPVEREINRIVEVSNVGLEDIAKEVDKGLSKATQQMSDLLEHPDPEIKVKAANAIKGIASHVVQRRRLQVDTVKKVVVKVGGSIAIPGHSAEAEE